MDADIKTPDDAADPAPASEDADAEIVLEADAPDEPSPSPKELAPQEGIADLKKRLEAERAAREEAERRAYAAHIAAQRHQAEAQDSNYQMVLSAIATVEQRATALRGAYAEAMTAGDYEKAAQIQEGIAVNAGHLSDLQRGKKAMEEAAHRQPVQKVEPPRDMIEDWAQQVTPRSANWLRAHKADLSSEAMRKRVILAHGLAQDDGIEPDSDAYFDFIERQIGLKRRRPVRQDYDEPDADSPYSAAAAPAPRRSAPPPAAPVSRGAPRGNAVRLSPEEREAARISGISEQEYARNREREKLRREGRA